MKIAVIHCIYKPHYRGGAETVVDNIVTGFHNRGHEAVVISVGYENKSEIIDGVKVYRIKPFNLFNFLDINSQPVWKRFFWHIIDMFNDVQIWRIYKILRAEKIDLALTHNLKGLGYEIPLLLKILGIRHIHTIHDMQLIHPSGLLGTEEKLSLPARVYCWFCRFLFNNPALVIFPSEYIRQIYGRLGFFKKSEVEVLGNPLAFNLVPKIAKNEIGSNLTIVFVGQVEEYKGIIDLIKAVDGLAGDWQLLIVGDGSALREATKWSLSNSKIKFLGHLSQVELEKQVWSRADLLVNPSQVAESFGMVIIEAYARGIPVIASSIGALPELVINDRTGWLFRSGDQYEIRQRLEFILTNRDRLSAMKGECIKMAERYTINNYLSKLLGVK